MRFHTILFDLDGTLPTPCACILSSFLHTVNHHRPEKEINEQEVIACLGEPLRDQMVRFGGGGTGGCDGPNLSGAQCGPS